MGRGSYNDYIDRIEKRGPAASMLTLFILFILRYYIILYYTILNYAMLYYSKPYNAILSCPMLRSTLGFGRIEVLCPRGVGGRGKFMPFQGLGLRVLRYLGFRV